MARDLFLDDDILIRDPDHVRWAVGLLDGYAATGVAIEGHPDGSVVGHANLAVGGQRRAFLAGGALAVAPRARTSFFPDIYNEDLLYLIDDTGPFPVALTGAAVQEAYDPFVDPQRAAAEEFGETLVVGLYYLARRGHRLRDSGEEYWRGFIREREVLLAALRERLQRHSTLDAVQAARISAALDSSRTALEDLPSVVRRLRQGVDRGPAPVGHAPSSPPQQHAHRSRPGGAGAGRLSRQPASAYEASTMPPRLPTSAARRSA
ncbi:hypothetical protein ACFQ0B_77645 [Nonomuraea thailandensis]